MQKPIKQLDTDLAELHAKVVGLAKVAQAKRVDLYKKQEEKKVAEKKAKEDKYLKDIFDGGVAFARWLLKPAHGVYSFEIPDFKCECRNIGEYVEFLMTSVRAFEHTTEGIRESIRRIDDRINSIPGSNAIFREAHTQRRISSLVDEKNPLERKLVELETTNERFWVAAHAHMEGFLETIFELSSGVDVLLNAVKVAMIAGTDTFHTFGGKVLGHLQTTVIAKIEERLSTGADIDEAGIKEIERILNEVGEAVKQQIKK